MYPGGAVLVCAHLLLAGFLRALNKIFAEQKNGRMALWIENQDGNYCK